MCGRIRDLADETRILISNINIREFQKNCLSAKYITHENNPLYGIGKRNFSKNHISAALISTSVVLAQARRNYFR